MLRTFKSQINAQFEILTEDKNTHMEHIEDLVLNNGVNGARQAINFLRYTRDHLAGHSKTKTNITIKMDGAPAIFAGIDPSDGEFFVAKKSIFNKNPKVYKTFKDIDNDLSGGDLNIKMKLALKYLPELGIKGVIQGDFLYSSDTIKRATIDNIKYLTFHPNTIVYVVPADSDLAKTILISKIGIVWHTLYRGKTLETLSASYNQPIANKLKKSKNVWSTGVLHKDVSGSLTMTVGETEQLSSLFSQAGKIFNTIPAAAFNDIAKNPELLIRIKTFDNSKIRGGVRIPNPTAHVNDMIEWIHNWYQKNIDTKKTDKGKNTWIEKRKEVMSYFSNTSKADIVKIYDLINVLIQAKLLIIKKLNEIKHLGTFLITKKGFQVTGHEGFVVADHLGKGGIKLVDRLQFSFANFSPDVLKGFDLKK